VIPALVVSQCPLGADRDGQTAPDATDGLEGMVIQLHIIAKGHRRLLPMGFGSIFRRLTGRLQTRPAKIDRLAICCTNSFMCYK